jgi:hypothetical protein
MHIYLYTTPTYQSKNWYKIGQSIRSPKTRIQQQDNASNPEPLIEVCSWNVPKNVSDRRVHAELTSLGFPKIRTSREWFELSETPIDDVEYVLTTLGNFEKYTKQEPQKTIFMAPEPLDYTQIWWYKNQCA